MVVPYTNNLQEGEEQVWGGRENDELSFRLTEFKILET